jgi:hypothetical protein
MADYAFGSNPPYALGESVARKVLGAEAPMIVRNAHVRISRLHVKLAVTCHQLHHTMGQDL